ncbi:Alpha/Beta hydrolase protein [Lentinula raphanica]|nr:Alpha/Beta hydrolase protein [Lentinula raphanica]
MGPLLFLLSVLSALRFTVTEVPSLELIHPRTVTQISASELAGFAPYTQFARAAYCPTDVLKTWTCGEACQANADFEVAFVGGDGDDIQNCRESDLTDIDIPLAKPSNALFPGISSSVEVHSGFLNEHALSARSILAEVDSLMASKGVNKIVAVGHSLGGALAEIDTVFLRLNIPSASISAMTYGTPRVGNPAWAALVNFLTLRIPRILKGTYISLDLIPIVPGRFLGFEHPAVEIHILGAGDAVSCPGDDDATDSDCQICADAFHLIKLGPYEGIYLGTIYCT